MSDPLRPVSPGERLPGIPAAGWNAAMDAARYVRSKRGEDGAGGAGWPLKQGTIVRVKNVSGSDVDAFGVLALGNAAIDPGDNLEEFQRVVLVEGDTPSSSDTLIGVPLEPIPDEGVGRCVVAGACPAYVEITSSAHTHARPDGATDMMVSDTSGPARIIYKEAGTPPYEAWCYVLLGGSGWGGGTCTVTFVTDICEIP